MKKLSLQDFAFPALSAFGIGEKNTISNGLDDGTLNCNVPHFWNPMRHGSTQQAVSNGLSAAVMNVSPPAPSTWLTAGVATSAGGLNICGHGNEGLIETGMGQNGPYNDAQIILPWNENAWGPELDRIKPTPITYLSLWACHPGAGQQGADLLFAMAKRCGRAVRGGTGFLYCNPQNLWWENGSVWQVATPANKPTPIPAPSPHNIMADNIRFEIDGEELGAADVVELVIDIRTYQSRSLSVKTIRGTAAAHAAASLFRSLPMDMSMGIGGMITAALRLTFKNKKSLEFLVYNDRLAVSQPALTGYYISSLRHLHDLAAP
jgi:hypothetical protein